MTITIGPNSKVQSSDNLSVASITTMKLLVQRQNKSIVILNSIGGILGKILRVLKAGMASN